MEKSKLSPAKLSVMDLDMISHDMSKAERQGKRRDTPEGSRIVVISDTLFTIWEKKIKQASQVLEGFALAEGMPLEDTPLGVLTTNGKTP